MLNYWKSGVLRREWFFFTENINERGTVFSPDGKLSE
jgi:hypothetical protein